MPTVSAPSNTGLWLWLGLGLGLTAPAPSTGRAGQASDMSYGLTTTGRVSVCRSSQWKLWLHGLRVAWHSPTEQVGGTRRATQGFGVLAIGFGRATVARAAANQLAEKSMSNLTGPALEHIRAAERDGVAARTMPAARRLSMAVGAGEDVGGE